MHAYVDAWRRFKPHSPPFLLPGDEALVQRRRGLLLLNRVGYEQSREFGTYRDTSLHLGLLPQPFHGRLETAKVYFLALNPGFSAGDYPAEERKDFRARLRVGYRGDTDMLFLDPTMSWHPGYQWWVYKTGLRATINELALRTKQTR